MVRVCGDGELKIKTVVDEDFTNYKKPSMVVGFPYCSFKCEKDCGMQVCQNSTLDTAPTIDIDSTYIVDRYMTNNITSAIIMAGLEPFDSYEDLAELILEFRNKTDDDIVIFTGYKKEEIKKLVEKISLFKNIIIKFGRYIPNCNGHFDDVLGIKLVSNNQYAERIS